MNEKKHVLKALAKKVRHSFRKIVVGPYRLKTANKLSKLRIVIGSSGHFERGWIPTDVDYLDITNERHWKRFFHPGNIDALLAEHVWEHLTPGAADRGAAMCFKYLKPGGYLRVAVPDGFHPDPDYIEHVRPGGTGPGADDHKVLYTYQSLEMLFSRAGFSVELLEYFDEERQFHFKDWTPDAGMISRSLRFEPRNNGGKIRYTSVLLDAHKVRD